ncbi:MAG TPA: hypothetical protein VGM75_36765 [Pseudonocardiaceae bacterium]
MANTQARWAIRNGRWTFGVADPAELAELCKAYTMTGTADRIICPTLVLEAENDQFFAGQPQQLLDELTCPKDLFVFAEADGTGEHCHEGALSVWHQRAFDWLDDRFSR